MSETHNARVVDWCYGWTGGVKIRCSCGDYWVLGRDATDNAVTRSIEQHIRRKEAEGA